MHFHFDTFQAFIHMGGYAPYVWSCYGIGLVVLVSNIISPIKKRRKIINQILRNLQRQELSS